MLEMIVDSSTRSVFLQRLVSCMEPHLSSCMYAPYMHAGGVSAATFCFIASSSLAVMCFIMFVWRRKTHTVTAWFKHNVVNSIATDCEQSTPLN